jgi:hypothetical protein
VLAFRGFVARRAGVLFAGLEGTAGVRTRRRGVWSHGRAASGGFAETVGAVFGRLRYSDGRYCAVEISSGRGGEAAREPMRSGIVSEASACIRLTMLDATDLRRWAERCYRASRTCFDLSAATELRVLGDELTARAIEVERAAYVDMRRVCVGDDNLR